MSSARDHAAALVLAFDRDGRFVADGLPERRERLADPRDRALLTELAYHTIRRLGTIDAVLARHSRRSLKTLHRHVRTALRVAACQLLFLDRVPDHAAVGHAVDWARAGAGDARAGYVNAVLRSLLRDRVGPSRQAEDPRRDVPRADGSFVRFRRPVFPHNAADPIVAAAPRHAMPVWLVRRWHDAFGWTQTMDLLRAGIARPSVGVRARRDAARLASRLAAHGLTPRTVSPSGALVVDGGERHVLDAVAAGEAWIQDPTSQRVVPLLGLAPGMRVLDLCAAPGGKSVQIADALGTGTLVASDVDADKVGALATLAPQLGDVRLETQVVPAEGPLPFAPGSFDAILVDAPCTNTGVLRRRVEARWRLRREDVASLAAIQGALLARAWPLLRPGGTLVYSTCSLEREEDEAVVEAFAAATPDAAAEVAFRAFPAADHDGGFAAILRRTT